MSPSHHRLLSHILSLSYLPWRYLSLLLPSTSGTSVVIHLQSDSSSVIVSLPVSVSPSFTMSPPVTVSPHFTMSPPITVSPPVTLTWHQACHHPLVPTKAGTSLARWHHDWPDVVSGHQQHSSPAARTPALNLTSVAEFHRCGRWHCHQGLPSPCHLLQHPLCDVDGLASCCGLADDRSSGVRQASPHYRNLCNLKTTVHLTAQRHITFIVEHELLFGSNQ